MKKYEIKYNLVLMNIFGTIYTLLLCILTFLLIYVGIGNFDSEITSNFTLFFGVFFLIYIFWIILHEIIHGIFYVIGGSKWKNISFGAALEKGILYCKSRALITKKNALISLQAPLVIIGIITYVISFFTGSYILLFLSIFNIYGACGDIVVFMFLSKLSKDTMFKEIGDTSTFMLETKDDLISRKYFGIKEINVLKDDDEFIDSSDKKVEISKSSILIFIFLIFICVFDILLGLFANG